MMFPVETESAGMTQLPLFQWFFGPSCNTFLGRSELQFNYQFKYVGAQYWDIPYYSERGGRKNIRMVPVVTPDLDLCEWVFDSWYKPLTPDKGLPMAAPCPTCGL